MLTLSVSFRVEKDTATRSIVKTVKELLRHANSRITLDVYTQAVNSNKRAAQSKVVKMMVSSEGTKAAIAGTTTPRKEVNNLLTVGHTFRKYFECMAGTTGLEPATS